MKISVLNLEGKEVGSREIGVSSETTGNNSEHVLYLVDKYQRAISRQGSASSKTKGEVSGGGSKPYKQKGTGHARRGSNRTPLRRGGGVVFGPKPRDFSFKLNKNLVNLSFEILFNHKSDRIIVLDPQDTKISTKIFSDFLKGRLVGTEKVTIILDETDDSLFKSSRNLPNVVFCSPRNMRIQYLNQAKLIIVSSTCFNQIADKVYKL